MYAGTSKKSARGWLITFVIVVWFVGVIAVYGAILSFRERGSNLGLLIVPLAFCLGIPFCLFGIIAGVRRGRIYRRIPIEAVAGFLVGVALLGLLGVFWLGRQMYDVDQVQAKSFVEGRIANAERITGGKPWPKTQNDFVGDETLPRLLQGRRFYTPSDDGRSFEIFIPVDFDGGWRLSSHKSEWLRST